MAAGRREALSPVTKLNKGCEWFCSEPLPSVPCVGVNFVSCVPPRPRGLRPQPVADPQLNPLRL